MSGREEFTQGETAERSDCYWNLCRPRSPRCDRKALRLGFDWLLIDGEHAPIGLETMQQMMQAINGSNRTPIVRPQWNDMIIIKRVLDIGVHGILVPWVNTKEEAGYGVCACKYPPEGLRGCGPRKLHFSTRITLKQPDGEFGVRGVSAVVEMAAASGITLVPPEKLDPLVAPPWKLTLRRLNRAKLNN